MIKPDLPFSFILKLNKFRPPCQQKIRLLEHTASEKSKPFIIYIESQDQGGIVCAIIPLHIQSVYHSSL
jgi:hypothetical protein